MDLKPFIPGRWTRNGHIQTVLGEIINTPDKNTDRYSEILTLSDGDKIILHTYPGKSDYVIIIGHGLTGSSTARYVISIAQELNQCGHTVVAINHRNCGDGAGLALGIYHSGRSDDLGQIVHHLKKKYPLKKIIAIGFSMSGNIVLKLLGDPKLRENAGISLPDAGIAINPPIDLGKSSALLNKGFNRLYEMNFLWYLSRLATDLYRRRGMVPKQNFSLWNTTMRDFDNGFTGPEGGFKDADDYYRTCSSLQFLAHIDRPTFILASKDDPFIDWHDFEAAKENPQIRLRIEEHGGHMGYISDQTLPHGSRRWLDYAIIEMIKDISDLETRY